LFLKITLLDKKLFFVKRRSGDKRGKINEIG